MKLFLISQTQNNDYDTCDSAVVAAPDEETARSTTPAMGSRWYGENLTAHGAVGRSM